MLLRYCLVPQRLDFTAFQCNHCVKMPYTLKQFDTAIALEPSKIKPFKALNSNAFALISSNVVGDSPNPLAILSRVLERIDLFSNLCSL